MKKYHVMAIITTISNEKGKMTPTLTATGAELFKLLFFSKAGMEFFDFLLKTIKNALKKRSSHGIQCD